MIDNGADDWRIAMSWERICYISLELLICAIHPIPGNWKFKWTLSKKFDNGNPEGRDLQLDFTCWIPSWLVVNRIQRRPRPLLMLTFYYQYQCFCVYTWSHGSCSFTRDFSPMPQAEVLAHSTKLTLTPGSFEFNLYDKTAIVHPRFVMKTLMTICPGTVLLVFSVSLWIIAAWTIRACERCF